MFLKIQNNRIIINNNQIHIAGTNILGNGRPLTKKTRFERNEYPKIGSENTIKGFNRIADETFP